MSTIHDYYQAFIEAGLQHGASEDLISQIKSMYYHMMDNVIWKAPEQIVHYQLEIKSKLAKIVIEYPRTGDPEWYFAMKRVFKTFDILPHLLNWRTVQFTLHDIHRERNL